MSSSDLLPLGIAVVAGAILSLFVIWILRDAVPGWARISIVRKILGPQSPYLKAGRLEDVIALIQVLGLDQETHRIESALETEGMGQAQSVASGSWIKVAREHPEFFRITPTSRREERVSLLARHFHKEGNEREPLSAAHVMTLIQTAVSTYAAQIHRQQIRRTGAIATAGVAFVGTVLTLANWALEHHQTIREVIKELLE